MSGTYMIRADRISNKSYRVTLDCRHATTWVDLIEPTRFSEEARNELLAIGFTAAINKHRDEEPDCDCTPANPFQ